MWRPDPEAGGLQMVKRAAINVAALSWALRAQPELWNQRTERTDPVDSPHHGLDDIWLRYARPGHNPAKAHESVWYAPASSLPVRDIVYSLTGVLGCDQLGGVLLTRIPPGGMCKPHTDPGWHARYYEKFAVQIEAAPGQAFHMHGIDLETCPGDLFWFDNSHEHWVTNASPYERVTLIVCMRRDQTVTTTDKG